MLVGQLEQIAHYNRLLYSKHKKTCGLQRKKRKTHINRKGFLALSVELIAKNLCKAYQEVIYYKMQRDGRKVERREIISRKAIIAEPFPRDYIITAFRKFHDLLFNFSLFRRHALSQ